MLCYPITYARKQRITQLYNPAYQTCELRDTIRSPDAQCFIELQSRNDIGCSLKTGCQDNGILNSLTCSLTQIWCHPMSSITQQCYTSAAPVAEMLLLIDVIAQNMLLLCRLDNPWYWVMPIIEELEHFALSATLFILHSLRCIALSEPVCAIVGHRGDAKLIAFATRPGLKPCTVDISNATPTCVPGVCGFLRAEQLCSNG